MWVENLEHRLRKMRLRCFAHVEMRIAYLGSVHYLWFWGERVSVLYSAPFNFCMTPLKGSNKLNGHSPQTKMSKTLMTPTPPPTHHPTTIFLHNYERDN